MGGVALDLPEDVSGDISRESGVKDVDISGESGLHASEDKICAN